MSKRKRRLVGQAALASLGALGLALWLLWPRTAINQTNYERIRVGTTLAEVEAVLGGPAGNYASRPVGEISIPPFEGSDRSESWLSDEHEILVRLDANDRVTAAYLFPTVPPRLMTW